MLSPHYASRPSPRSQRLLPPSSPSRRSSARACSASATPLVPGPTPPPNIPPQRLSANPKSFLRNSTPPKFSRRPEKENQEVPIILSTAETEIAEKFAVAAEVYKDNPVALHLRGMNMLFEGLKEKGSMVIVPSSALETMNLGAQLGTAALAKQ